MAKRFREIAFDFIGFTTASAPVSWGVKDDAIIDPASAKFTIHELVYVIDNPTDGVRLKTIQRGIATRPLNHSF